VPQPPNLPPRPKRPESVLVAVYAATGKVLLLKRADHPDFWQSVTGSLTWEETDSRDAAMRELREETGIVASPDALRDLALTFRFPIFPQWRYRYAPEVSENLEHAFAYRVPEEEIIDLNPQEHTAFVWLPFAEAAARVTSWTNRKVIERIAAASR
jgi:dihydroneopterin triphosphate diphosphatase